MPGGCFTWRRWIAGESGERITNYRHFTGMIITGGCCKWLICINLVFGYD